jgi:hypothetical protein
MVERLLDTAGENLVLVGGQVLALWVSWYDLALRDESVPAISNDVDFLSKSAADRQSVRRLADAIKGQVLYSRLINLHKLPEKQNDKGRMQLALAIDVGRAFLRQEAKETQDAETAIGRSPIQEYVSTIEKMAMDDAGRKVAARHGLHVADAIDPHLIPPGPFWTKRWPALEKLMSPQYSGTIRPPNAASEKKRS